MSMPIPENPLELPQEEQTKYFDGLKGYRNKVINFNFILRSANRDYEGFVECIRNIFTDTDYAGLHATDPNWYEEGGYQTGILEPPLMHAFDRFLRAINFFKFKEENYLTPVCHFTQTPDSFTGFAWGHTRSISRPDLMIVYEGGLFKYWGQWASVYLVDGSDPFVMDANPSLIEEIKSKARSVGKLEMTDEEYKIYRNIEYADMKEKAAAIERYWAEQEIRWGGDSE